MKCRILNHDIESIKLIDVKTGEPVAEIHDNLITYEDEKIELDIKKNKLIKLS